MGAEAALAAWLQPEALVAFVDDLRRRARFRLDVRHYERVRDIGLAVTASGIADSDPQRLGALLAPVVCQSAAEQREFQRYFDAWIAGLGRKKARRDHISIDTALEHAGRRSRQWLWGIGIVIVSLAVVVWIYLRIPSPIVPAPQNSPTPIIVDVQNPASWGEWIVSVMLFIVAGAGVWTAVWLWLGRRFLQRETTTLRPSIETLRVSGTAGRLFDTRTLARVAAAMRTRVAAADTELAVADTIDRTVRQGGLFSPVVRNRRVIPEYLALIDRVSAADHQAALVDQLLKALSARGVFITSYAFDGDPRLCMPERPGDEPLTLRRLAQRYSRHRLMVFASTAAFADPVSGRLAPWVAECANWRDRAIFVPGPERLGAFEQELEEIFAILPATLDGVMAWNAGLISNSRARRPDSGAAAGELPRAVAEDPDRWLSRIEPDDEEARELLGSMRARFSPPEFAWISACAVYPAIQWNLTTALGQAFEQSVPGLLRADRLAAIGQLPWFRHGFMPDWLRRRVVDTMSRSEERAARRTLDSMLLSSLQGGTGDLALEIARGGSPVLDRLSHAVRGVLRQQPDAPPELRDYVFVRFMAGRRARPLSVVVPEGLRRVMGRGKQLESSEAMFAAPHTRLASDRVAAALCYAIGPFAFFFLRAHSAFVRFNAWQSVVFSALFFLLSPAMILGIVAVVETASPGPFSSAVLALIVAWSYLCIGGWAMTLIQTANGRRVLIPWVGRFCWQRAFRQPPDLVRLKAERQWTLGWATIVRTGRLLGGAMLCLPRVYLTFVVQPRALWKGLGIALLASGATAIAAESRPSNTVFALIGQLMGLIAWTGYIWLVAWIIPARLRSRKATDIPSLREMTSTTLGTQTEPRRVKPQFRRLLAAMGLAYGVTVAVTLLGGGTLTLLWSVPSSLIALRAALQPPDWVRALIVLVACIILLVLLGTAFLIVAFAVLAPSY